LYSVNHGHNFCLLKERNNRIACDVYFLVVVQLLVSGGVDSTVCAALLHKALCEDQVIAVHIDNGFMRKNESQRVEQSLEKLGLRVKGSVQVP
jgi:GMP synthase (glutamine-hydrolysing)